jgi:type II secretion system protein N
VASKKRLIFQGLAYLLYGLVVLIVVLYVTFPYDLLSKRFAERFSQGDLQLAIARLRPSFPLGMQLQQLRLLTTAANPPQTLLQVETLRAQPDFLAAFSETLDMHLEAALYNGRMQGQVRTAVLNRTAPWEITARFGGLRVEQHPLFQKDGQAFLRGRLHGDGSATVDGEGTLQQGTLNLHLEPMVFIGNQTLQLPLPREVACNTVQTQLSMAPGQLQIGSFTCRGDDLLVQAKGTVRWQQPLATSTLDLQIEIRSENTYKQELEFIASLVRRRPTRGTLVFRLRGTLQEPRLGV